MLIKFIVMTRNIMNYRNKLYEQLNKLIKYYKNIKINFKKKTNIENAVFYKI